MKYLYEALSSNVRFVTYEDILEMEMYKSYTICRLYFNDYVIKYYTYIKFEETKNKLDKTFNVYNYRNNKEDVLMLHLSKDEVQFLGYVKD